MNLTLEAEGKPTILVVDDTPDNLALVSGLLKDTYKVKVAPSGEKALQHLQGGNLPDLVLLDIMMPEMDGYEVLRRLKSYPSTRDIPVIFLTAKSEVEDERLGLDMGAVDYITKPLSPPILLSRVRNHLQLKEARDFLKDKAVYLQMEVNRRSQELATIQEVTIMALVSLAETRDNETGNHIRRVQLYVKLLAEHLRTHPRFEAFLSQENIDLLYKSVPLHDIGKVGIPDRILLKAGRFVPEEFEVMKRHALIGKEAIETAERQLRALVPFLRLSKEIAYGHHEKWDGTGYPLGLKGDQIPASARLMAVADVYDALISRRIYKPGLSHQAAMEEMVAGRGTHFDPDILDALVDRHAQFQEIAARFGDTYQDLAQKYQKMQESQPGPSGVR
ncbi:MAG TPA: two-component system response regulator [Geothrix sp.]|nr:two-component system response regulator [Geothrix sp.]